MKNIKTSSNSKSRWRKMMNTLLRGSHQHFLAYLPAQKGMFSSWIMKRFYSGIKDDERQLEIIRSLPKDATIVYLNKFKSYFDFLFYHSRFIQNRLPVPEIGLNYRVLFFQPISRLLRTLLSKFDYLTLNWKLPDPYRDGYYHAELNQGTSAFVSLVNEKGFYKRFLG